MRRKCTGFIGLLAALALAAGLLSGCSGGSSASTASGNAAGSADTSYEMAVEEPAMAAEEDVIADGDTAYEPGMDGTSDGGASKTAGEENDALKIVYTGYISVETTEYDKTLEELKELFGKYGIKTARSSESDSASYYYNTDSTPVRTLELTLRVPAEHFTEFFDATGSITGSIRSKSTDSQDLTKQYNDRAVQIESLEIQQQNLLKMMEAAETVEDMILIEDRLTDIRTELRQLTSANEQIDYDVTYSEVNMYIREVKIYTETKETETFLERISRSISESAESFLANMQDLLVALIFLLPYIVIIAVVVFLFRKPIRALREKHKEKSRLRKEERMKRKAEKAQAKRSKYGFQKEEPAEEKKEQP